MRKGYLSGLGVLQHTSKNHYGLFLQLPLIQAQTDPIVEDLPASCTNWRTPTVGEGGRGFPMLHQHREVLLSTALLYIPVYMCTRHIYTSTVCCITSSDFLNRKPLKLFSLFFGVCVGKVLNYYS